MKPDGVRAVAAANNRSLVTKVDCDIGIPSYAIYSTPDRRDRVDSPRQVIDTFSVWDFCTNWAAESEELMLTTN